MHSNFSSERKAALWMNALEHYKGNHTNCLHAPYKSRLEEVMGLPKWAVPMTEGKSDALRIFLNATLKYVTNVDARYSTQRNEGFHSMKAQMARKDICWGYVWEARVAIAILKVNDPHYWIKLIMRGLVLLGSSISHQ